jgi:OOP family OmpA-OmpF porin
MPEGYGFRVAEDPAAGARDEAPAAPVAGYWLHFVRREGSVVVAGRMPDRTGVAAIEALASASFVGQGPPAGLALTVGQGPAPEGWQAAAIATLEAVAGLDSGEAALTAGRLRIDGRLGDPAAIGRLHRDLAERLPGYTLSTRLTVDMPRLVAAVPLTAARCAVLLNAEMARRGVGFAPGSAVIDAEGPGVLDRAAAILRRCPDARIEIGGHTDSQGSAEFNRRLSLARAEAVRSGLAERGVAAGRLTAEGYGESRPIAGNDTPEGRARNRRIAFRPLETAS